MIFRIKNTALTLTIISWLQIVGGITGIGLMAYLMLQTGTINGALLLIFLFGLSLFIYSIYSGKRLLRDAHKSTGVVLSIINQLVQIFQWNMFGYGLAYGSGAAVTIGLQGVTFNFSFAAIVSTFKMAINSNDEFFFKINLIAVLVTFVLVDILSELKEKKQEETEERETKANELAVE